MKSLRNRFRGTGAFFAGILLGLSAVTPAFAAVGELPLTATHMILIVSCVLLAIGIALKLLQSQQRRLDSGSADLQDLRWWLTP